MRVIRISLAYLAAAAVAVIALLLLLWAIEGFGNLAGSATLVSFGIPFAAVIAAPVAVPAIIYSEWRGVSAWWFFAVAGGLCGILVSALFEKIPTSTQDASEASAFLAASVIAALSYRLFAGRRAGQAYGASGQHIQEHA